MWVGVWGGDARAESISRRLIDDKAALVRRGEEESTPDNNDDDSTTGEQAAPEEDDVAGQTRRRAIAYVITNEPTPHTSRARARASSPGRRSPARRARTRARPPRRPWAAGSRRGSCTPRGAARCVFVCVFVLFCFFVLPSQPTTVVKRRRDPRCDTCHITSYSENTTTRHLAMLLRDAREDRRQVARARRLAPRRGGASMPVLSLSGE